MKAHSYVATLSDIKKRIFATSEMLSRIRAIEEERLSISVGAVIDRMGNLNHNMLLQIVQFFSLPVERYAAFGPLLDEALLNHRNKIAHGEYLDVSVERYGAMHGEVVAVIELFKSDIEDAVVGKSYRRTEAVPVE